MNTLAGGQRMDGRTVDRYIDILLISILPKNHAGPVEKLISDFFRMPKKLAQ